MMRIKWQGGRSQSQFSLLFFKDLCLASQDALEVVLVTEWVSHPWFWHFPLSRVSCVTPLDNRYISFNFDIFSSNRSFTYWPMLQSSATIKACLAQPLKLASNQALNRSKMSNQCFYCLMRSVFLLQNPVLLISSEKHSSGLILLADTKKGTFSPSLKFSANCKFGKNLRVS